MENNKMVDIIINHFRELLLNNENIIISKEDIYEYLIKYSMEENIDISEDNINFDTKKLNNIKYSKDNNYIFTNKTRKIKSITPIKIYVPTNYLNISDTTNKILSFFNKTYMAFEMKVNNNNCNNNISLILDNISDMNKFLTFIKNNKKINSNLVETHPFCFNKQVALTIDGNQSYISILSDYLYKYLESKKENIDNISTDDFYNFIIDSYNNTFINFSKYNELEIPNIDNPDEIDIFTYKKITEFILKVSEENFDKKSFEEHFNECNNQKAIKEERYLFLTLNTLIKYISFEKQYKTDEEILNTLKKYLETNNLSYITNKGFFRTTMYLTNFKLYIEKILNNSNLSLEELINNLKIDTYKKIDDNILDEVKTQNRELYLKLLDDEDIKLYLATNDYTLLSRKDNLRVETVNTNFRNNILNILYNNNISLEEFIEQYKTEIIDNNEEEPEVTETNEETINNDEKSEIIETNEEENLETTISEEPIINTDEENIDEEALFINALMDTYNKYQALYDENKVECDGFALVNYALTNAIKNNDYSSFTRDNDSRKILSQLGNKKILEFIFNKFEYKNINIANINEEELRHIVTIYLDNILFDNNEKTKGL